MESGNPSNLKILLIKESAVIEAVGRQRKGIKCVILVNLSTTIMAVVISLDFGNSTIKSFEISDQGLFGIDKGEGRSYGLCLRTLALQQISQDLTNILHHNVTLATRSYD